MSTADWWARKLNAPAPTTPRPPAAPASVPTPWGQTYTTPAQQAPTRAHLPSERAAVGGCPECGSDNYFAMPSGDIRNPHPPAPRCFECGYPVRQSTSGMSGVRSQGQAGASPSRQAAGGREGASNYHPETIVGRIG